MFCVKASAAKVTKQSKRKPRMERRRKKHFVDLCFEMRQNEGVINLKDFFDKQPELNEGMNYTTWLRLATKDPRIQESFKTKGYRESEMRILQPSPEPGIQEAVPTKADREQDMSIAEPPPEPGWYLQREGDELIYTCGCRMHVKLLDNQVSEDYSRCHNCNSNVVVWGAKERANAALQKVIEKGNLQEDFVWPDSCDMIPATRPWNAIGPFAVLTEWMEKKKRKKALGPIPTGTEWKEYLARDNAFMSWVADNIKVMAISINSMSPLNHVDETSGAQCPSNFCIKNPIWNWNPNQVLENQDDDVFRLVTFDNGDYACIGTLQLTDPVIVDIAKKDTQVIPTCGYAKRRGVSGGYHYPAEKGANCSSFSKACESFNKVDIKPTSHSTGLDLLEC
jgi:hypothetical protein